MLITESERVTILPAISFAFGSANDLSTPNDAGATTAPKKRAAPNQHASKINREKFMKSVLDRITGFSRLTRYQSKSSIVASRRIFGGVIGGCGNSLGSPSSNHDNARSSWAWYSSRSNDI